MAVAKKQKSNDMQSCIQICQECHAICLATAAYCLEKGFKEQARILLDCAEIGQTCMNFMLRGSSRHHLTCGVCAEICNLCAESCNKIFDDKQLKHCADVCQRCAVVCNEIA